MEEVEPVFKKKKEVVPLKTSYYNDSSLYEIGVDEVGRGPMFGRVYTAAVCLPKEESGLFNHTLMKDSKKFTGKNNKKILEVAEYIKANAIAWSVSYEDEKVIDEINILQATQKAMHTSISDMMKKMDKVPSSSIRLLVDGNYFKSYVFYDAKKQKLIPLESTCIEGGDNKYTAIAAASILAKVARDEYIADLCSEHPDLIEKYSLDSNKGYGSKAHMAGILEHGISPWHRKTFGICKQYSNKN
jgi:ribonuclease HII